MKIEKKTASSCTRAVFLLSIAIFAITGTLTPLAASAQIGPSFFGMGAVDSTDMPKVSYGILSHPPLAWTAIEGTARGVYDFDSTDAYVAGAPKDDRGVAQIDIVFGWTPGWAVANQSNCSTQSTGLVVCTVPPDNMSDWTDFITAVAGHYNGVNAPQVAYYEIWNEANTPSFWTSSASELVMMAQIAYPILKQNKYSQVLTPSVTWSPGGTTWMGKFLAGGGSSVADALGFHAYTSKTGKGDKVPVPLPESPLSTNEDIQGMITAYRAVADANGMADKPLVTTEGGWGVNGVTDSDFQAAWIAQYEIVQAGMAASNNLVFQTWYTWGHGSSGTIETSSGEPTQAGLAYQEVYTWLVGTTPAPCTSSGDVWSCAVDKNLIVWNEAGTCTGDVCTTVSYTAPVGYTKYVDLSGTVTMIDGSIALSALPIMMEP
jgi:hypothetical protein